jgi:hypothetical protein
MTAGKMNCSTECPLDGTPGIKLGGLLNGWKRIRLPGGSTVRKEDQYRTSIEILRKIEYHRRRDY